VGHPDQRQALAPLSQDTAYKLDRFYEVDLPELLATSDVEAFLYFYVFFSRSAFVDQPLGLTEILRESTEYAQGVGDSLKGQVYEALRHLAQGFLDYPPNGLKPDPKTLSEIYDNSLILLYRLLFVLYAESRDLLPVRESEMYRSTYSLHAIKHEVAQGRPLLPTSAKLWPDLQELFGIINRGSPPLSVATFDGGLFDPERYPFLERYAVGDGHLQKAVDLLSRVDGQFVDYRDLAERHLGTIYEGLLEFHLEALSELEEDWTVELLNDRGERKATGSFYTPDFVVEYIVDKAVGPLLEEAVAGKKTDQGKVEAVLGLNVLDLSMGSGHFLVEATERIARFLVEMSVAPEDAETDGEAELAYWKRRVVQSCVYGVDSNPLAVELAKLSLWLATVAKDRPLSFLDHHLRCGNSLVGARITELQPRGARKRGKKAKQDDSSQLSMTSDPAFQNSMSTAVGSMWLIEESPADTVEEVKEQELIYERLRENLTRRYARLADLATATHFGVEVDRTHWKALAHYAAGRIAYVPPQFERWLDEAAEIAERQRFFHWELEFPEVYFDRQGRPKGDEAGFDAVVGNPPYVRQEALGQLKLYLSEAFPEVYHGTADLFVYFFGQGLRQLRRSGGLSYISSNSWLRANFAVPLRSHLRTHTTVEKLIDLGDNRVFADAPDVYPAIHVVRRDAPPVDHTAQAAVFTRGEGLANFEERVASKLFSLSIHDQLDTGWQLGDVAGRRVFAKLMAGGTPLGEVANGQMYRGVLTGLNEAFIIDTATRDRLVEEDPASAEIIRPIVNGEDVRPWFVEDEGRWLILLKSSSDHGWPWSNAADEAEEVFRQTYPSLHARMKPLEERLRKRQDRGRYWWELRPCSYYEDFEGFKVFWPEMAKQPRFALAAPGVIGNKTTFMIPGDNSYLLGTLMARVTWFAISRINAPIGERTGMLRYLQSAQFMSRLPIPTAPEAKRETISTLAREITEVAHARYDLHQKKRHRILSDLGAPGKKLNQRLTAWWNLNFPAFRAEGKKVFKKDIPLAERDEWEEWLAKGRTQHESLTAEIVRLETELNAHIYELFDLTPEEIRTIEQSTKYRYGEV
jgi:hypothetical protein